MNDKNTEYVQSSAHVSGITIDELINNLIAQHIQEDPYEQKWKHIMQAVDGFTEDCFEDFENERLNIPPQEREKL